MSLISLKTLTHDVEYKRKGCRCVESVRLSGVVASPTIGQADSHPRVVTVTKYQSEAHTGNNKLPDNRLNLVLRCTKGDHGLNGKQRPEQRREVIEKELRESSPIAAPKE